MIEISYIVVFLNKLINLLIDSCTKSIIRKNTTTTTTTTTATTTNNNI